MAQDTFVLGQLFNPIPAGELEVTPTGGVQGKLADLLMTATGGAVAATTLTASSTVTLSPADHNVTIEPSGTGKVDMGGATAGTINNMSIGVTTPLAGKFTTLIATDAVTLSPASKDVVISPSGTGKITMAPVGASTMDNVAIGGTTPLAGKFTTLTGTGVVLFSNASVSMTAIPTADPHVIGRLWANSGVLTISAG